MTFGQKPLTRTLKKMYPLCGGYRLPLGSLCTMCLGHLHLRLTIFDWLVHTILQNDSI